MAITDLTNTTWEIPAGWTASAGYGQFSINGTYSGNDFTHLHIGYRFVTDTYTLTAMANLIALMYNGAFIGNTANAIALTLTITGGTDVTNTSLISWLEANGTLQGGEEAPTPKLYIGSKAVKSMSIGNKEILKMYVGNSLVYEKASGEESVSITLDHQSEGLQAVSNYGVYVKFGTRPTSGTDYDYYFNPTSHGGYVYDSTNTLVTTPFTTSVKPIAYIWCTTTTGWARYSLNGGAKQYIASTTSGYNNSVEVQLQNGDTLTVYTAVPD